MKTVEKILILSYILFFYGCSSHHDVVSVSDIHLYDDNYGLAQNEEIDIEVNNELISMNSQVEVEIPQSSNPEWTTELKMEEGAFLAEDYVQKPPVITYKYKFDDKFYDKAEWRAIE